MYSRVNGIHYVMVSIHFSTLPLTPLARLNMHACLKQFSTFMYESALTFSCFRKNMRALPVSSELHTAETDVLGPPLLRTLVLGLAGRQRIDGRGGIWSRKTSRPVKGKHLLYERC